MRTQDTTDIFRGIATIGRLTGHDSAATAVATSVRDTLESIARAAAGRPIPSVFYVVYNNPPMTAGPHTFINQLISLAGGRSIFADASQQWPSVAMEEIVRRDPDILIVPEGEFTSNSLDRFNELAGWRSLRAVREGRVVGVSADLMSRPSPSIARAARVLFTAFHPEGDAPAPEGARR
jgi:iron complex transport system substrate-binding protein